PSGIVGAPNALEIAGGPITVNEAEAALPVSISSPSKSTTAVIALDLLFLTPIVVPVTSTLSVQLAPPASEGMVTGGMVAPALAPTIVVPAAQVVEKFGMAATATPAGRLSLNARVIRPLLSSSLVIVKVNVEVPPSAMLAGLNALEIEGGSNESSPTD